MRGTWVGLSHVCIVSTLVAHPYTFWCVSEVCVLSLCVPTGALHCECGVKKAGNSSLPRHNTGTP